MQLFESSLRSSHAVVLSMPRPFRLLAIIAVFLLSVSIAGCEGDDSDPEAGAGPDAQSAVDAAGNSDAVAGVDLVAVEDTADENMDVSADCIPGEYAISPEYPETSDDTAGLFDCEGGVVMAVSGLVDSEGNVTVRVTKPDGSPLGAGTYFVRVFAEDAPYEQRCSEINVVKAETTTAADSDTVEFEAFPSLANCGESKIYCVTKEDGGDEAFWCSGGLWLEY